MLEQYLETKVNDADFKPHQIGASIQTGNHAELISRIKVGIITVSEGRNYSSPNSVTTSVDHIYQELMQLSARMPGDEIAYLGSLKPGARFEDSIFALEDLCKELIKQHVLPVIIGGSRDLLLGMYRAFEGISENLDLSFVSADLPLGDDELLGKICLHEPNYLFNMNLLGFQGHFVSPKALETLNKLGFEHMRLGALKSKMEDAEPLLRNTNIYAFDIGAVKQADAPGNLNANPIGLDGDMACQLCWYAGVSDTTSAFGVFEVSPDFDYRNQTSKLTALMIWYFLDGVNNRKKDHPRLHDEFVKYRCNLNGKYPDIVFHKSKRTSRWWMEMPNPKSLNNKDKNVLLPCSYADYQSSAKGEIPERYLRSLQKMH